MGSKKKQQPERLPEKLKNIREFLYFSQSEMFRQIHPGVTALRSARSIISEFESGRRTPSLLEVYMYAEAVRELTKYKNFSSDDIISDEQELPWVE